MKVEISNGELLDKISILELKMLRIEDEVKLVNIQKFDDTSLNIAKYQLENFNLTVNKRSGNNSMNHQIMNYFENQNNVNLDFSEILYELNE